MRWISALLRWQKQHGRRLPWMHAGAYEVWLSELMLQQTQVTTVLPKYNAFLAKWPTVEALAGASLDEVLALWAGLGYYRRARYVYDGAQQLAQHKATHGAWPSNVTQWQSLPGVGRSTAHAIMASVYNQPYVIWDANAARVLSRVVHGKHPLGYSPSQTWSFVEHVASQVPREKHRAFNQALMDLGSSYCKSTPHCDGCPLKTRCKYASQGVLPSSALRKAPKKDRVELFITWYIYRRPLARQVWLTQRDAGGIWPGLWTFSTQLESKVPSAPVRRFGPHTHLLTHRTLVLQASVVDVTEEWSPTEKGQWFSLDALPPGLPAPVAVWWRELAAPAA